MPYKIQVMLNREGWYFVGMLSFIIAGAIIRDINLLYVMAGMMLGPLVLSLVTSIRNLRRLRFSRRFPHLVAAGEPLIVELLAEKTGGQVGSFAVVAEERISREDIYDAGAGEQVKLFYSLIPANSKAEACYRLRLHERGRYRFDPVRVSTSMPIGLIRASMAQGLPEYVLVSPRVGKLLPAWSQHLMLSKEGGQKSKRRRGRSEGDFYGIREWRNGDSKSWIHWRTSAKRNKLAVRQFEQRISQDLVVVLDLRESRSASELPPGDAVESAVSFAATLVCEHSRLGTSHLLVASASRHAFLLRGTSSTVFRTEVMERLAMVQPTGEERLPDLLAETLPLAAANSKIVVVSNRQPNFADRATYSRLWNEANLRRRFTDMITVCTTSSEFRTWFVDAATVHSESRLQRASALQEASER